MGWRGPVTDRQLRVWTAWFDLYYNGDKGDLSMDGCVPPEVQRRWEGKVSNAGYLVAAATERRLRAQAQAKLTGEDVGEVYDRLVKENR